MTEARNARLMYFDANIFIYLVEGWHGRLSALDRLVGAIEDGTITAVTSALTLAEVLVKPLARGDRRYIETYSEILADNAAVRVGPVTREVLVASARWRAEHGGKLPDSIHVATAELNRCGSFLSEDTRIRVPDGMRFSDLSGIEATLNEIAMGKP